MPEIPVGAQIFDVVFHPTFCTVYTGLLTGHVKAFAYDEQGNHKSAFALRPSKSSCRGLSLNQDGSHLYAVGKAKSLFTIDTKTEDIVDVRSGAHDVSINRVKSLVPQLLSTGDDDGTVKLWDPRQKDSVREYTHHFDYITDFLWIEDKKQLVTTSGDGTLSVIDVRSKKPEPIAHSEDQEDELLSIASIKGGSKFVVGTQIGILSIFNRNSGWGDCVDRIPGHPMSVDAVCSLPPDLPNVDTTSTILTGSSDGYVRAVQILPTKLLGVVADHGEWPIERISIGSGQQGLTIDQPESGPSTANVGSKKEEDEDNEPRFQRKWWVGSVGHEDVLRMTDLEGFFRDNEGDENEKGALGVQVSDEDSDSGGSDGDDAEHEVDDKDAEEEAEGEGDREDEDENSDDENSDEESDVPQQKKRKRKPEPESKIVPKKRNKNTVVAEPSFFDDL
ncbi:hypothetical protein D9613_011731 [Agrocybe pediades]|uniref:WD repeat-containing protein JIP5 n=1 Tax=Agrocybe pediades TaxID=84607 RepID=A0A8H4QKT4_9AGAR|nr:hypothetical protein D9613_011731 [Agrocybe pediades]